MLVLTGTGAHEMEIIEGFPCRKVPFTPLLLPSKKGHRFSTLMDPRFLNPEEMAHLTCSQVRTPEIPIFSLARDVYFEAWKVYPIDQLFDIMKEYYRKLYDCKSKLVYIQDDEVGKCVPDRKDFLQSFDRDDF